ncbi:MAG: protein phosphatase 2C domain-containing protein [Chthoniobacter sp.]|uniref:PP2C family protein-serine/threonine phosphatase n=1 Tax=Chthoniobacter sp. TaxID=2510640 RepID=UPI0032A20D1E
MDPSHKSGPALRLRWCGVTDRGKVRKNNEDSFVAIQFDAQELRFLGKVGEDTGEHHDFVFAVSDGMGGAMAGEFASRITIDKISHLLPRSYRLGVTGLESGFADVLEELFAQVHRALTYLGGCYEECAGMGATLSLGWFTPGWMFFAHIGDSRIYYLSAREGVLRQITHDDTYVGWLFRQGQINEREARTHPRRNVLQRALGAGNQFVDPQVGAVACEPGDVFLFCTDGVVEGLYDHALTELLRRPAAATATNWNPAQQLVTTSIENAGRDNTTAVVVEVLEP